MVGREGGGGREGGRVGRWEEGVRGIDTIRTVLEGLRNLIVLNTAHDLIWK